MQITSKKTDKVSGEVEIPGSKSHSIRAVVFASLANGKSTIKNMLESEDTKAAINACEALGASITKVKEGRFEVSGFGGNLKLNEDRINTGNSGTTTNIITSVAALTNKEIIIDGDDSIRKRSVKPLIDSIEDLGGKADSIKNNGCPPILIKGKMEGGKTILDCQSSQYLSSLLISCPLLEKNTRIEIKNICEKPYIEMTLKWLDELDIEYENKEFEEMKVFGNQKYREFEKIIPSDWSSATFLLVAGVMLGKNLTIKGMDLEDSQPDKKILSYLEKMGADIEVEKDEIIVNKSELEGCELDLDSTPDALPALAVLGCYSKGKTILKNVSHARLKETDRISVMKKELEKMGADIEEREDRLLIKESKLEGKRVDGHEDHRVIMALSLAGLIADGNTTIENGGSIGVTFPGYIEVMNKIGANIIRNEE